MKQNVVNYESLSDINTCSENMSPLCNTRLLSLYVFLECVDLAEQIEEQILNNNMPDLEDGVTYENQEDAVVMIGESPVGAEMTVNQPCETNTGFLEGAIEIYSLIVTKSHFFPSIQSLE